MSTDKTTITLEANISAESYAAIQQAAELSGQTVSEFSLTAAETAAQRVLEQTHVLRLSPVDQQSFAEALLNPPEASPALQKAFERHTALFQ